MGFTAFGGNGPLQLQAQTPVAGFALADGTPDILSWQVPDDGQQHRVTVFATLDVATALTGGLVHLLITDPAGNAGFPQVFPANETAGVKSVAAAQSIVGPGTTVTLAQGSAVTAGAAVLYAEIWGS